MEGEKNILLITSDQQHWNTLGLLNDEISTPNLDRLANEGMLFARAYCPNPTCSPTRASIITGKYPSQHGCYSLGTKLAESELTIGDILNKAGYQTTLVGKAHFQPLASTEDFPSLEAYPILQDLDFWREFNGPFYGFNHVELARNHVDEAHVGQHYALWMEEKGFTEWRECYQKPTGISEPQRWEWNIPEEYHYNTWIAERTNKLMEEYVAEEQPFFMWASFFDPHPPYLVPEPWASMYEPEEVTVPALLEGEHSNNPPHFQLTQEDNPDYSSWKVSDKTLHGFHSHKVDTNQLKKDIAVYYGMVSMMDKYIGQILDKLEELGISDETLVVFTTDHGHFFGQHGLTAKGPFHYEDMIKIPFIVKCPGKVPANQHSEALQSLVDLAPTFLDFLGLDIPRSMTGINQLPVWSGETSELRNTIIVENRHEPNTVHCKTYINKRYKLTVYYQRDYGELFDLEKDPNELYNQWDNPTYAELKDELTLQLLFAEMAKEPVLMPRIDRA